MKLLRNCRNIKITWKTIDLTALIRTPFTHIHVVTHQKVVILKSFRHTIEAKYFNFFFKLNYFELSNRELKNNINFFTTTAYQIDWNKLLLAIIKIPVRTEIQVWIFKYISNAHTRFIPHKCPNISCIGSKTL